MGCQGGLDVPQPMRLDQLPCHQGNEVRPGVQDAVAFVHLMGHNGPFQHRPRQMLQKPRKQRSLSGHGIVLLRNQNVGQNVYSE
jgi:hypothetical protein